MKKFISHLFIPTALLAMTVFVSCNDNDEEDDYQEPPTDTTPYPYTSEFAGTPSNTFAMYSNGDTVNTDTLDYNDFVDGDVSGTFTDSAHSAISFTWTADSVFNGDNGFPYYVTNDSVFVEFSFVENGDTINADYLLGEGPPNNFTLTKSFAQYCDYDQDGVLSGCSTLSASSAQSLESVAESEDIPISSLEEILENDTLLIINQKVTYQ
jgi:hypothetical protein